MVTYEKRKGFIIEYYSNTSLYSSRPQVSQFFYEKESAQKALPYFAKFKKVKIKAYIAEMPVYTEEEKQQLTKTNQAINGLFWGVKK